MEGIDLAGVVDSDFQGIQINFAPPRRICQFLRGGARLAFLWGGMNFYLQCILNWQETSQSWDSDVKDEHLDI